MLMGVLMGVALAATPVTLDEVREKSRENLESLRAALNAERALLQQTQARSGLLPQITAFASGGLQYNGPREEYYTAPDGSVSPLRIEESRYAAMNLGVSLRQLIYDGAVWARLSAAGATSEAAKGEAKEQMDASELEGIRRFFDLYRAQETLKVMRESVTRSEQQVAIAESLYSAGRGPQSDVLNARINLGNDQIGVINQRSALANAQADLAAWLRMKGTTELIAQDPGESPIASQDLGIDDAVQAAEANRPLLVSLQERVKAAKATRSQATAAFIPRVSLFGQYNRSAPYADLFFTRWGLQNSLNAGVQVEWDVFNGFSDKAGVDIASRDVIEAEANYQQTRRDIEADLRKAWMAVSLLKEAETVSEANRNTAREALSALNERFSAGLATQLEVRDSELKVTQAELNLVQSRLDVEVAKATLERVLGTLSGGTRS